MQRVKRAERLKRQRGFVYRRPLVNFNAVIGALYPMPGTDWPSAATVEAVVLVGHFPRRRPVTLTIRVKRSGGPAEAMRRAQSKLRLPEGEAYRLCKLGPVTPYGVPKLGALLYRDAPLFGMLKREVSNG